MSATLKGPETKTTVAVAPLRKTRSIVAKVLLTLVAVIAAFAGYVAVQPNDYRVERSITIAAPTSEVFAQVNDFHNWEAWSPWAKLDPAAKNSFEGPSSGIGAMFSWDGNDQVGAGRMTVIEHKPNELIRIRLDFTRPFEDTGTAEFAFQPVGEQTKVTWSMYGRQNFLGKAICLFMNMDKMLGGEFEKGLASMKEIVERQ